MCLAKEKARVQGNPMLLVSYKNKVYTFSSRQTQSEFMSRPEDFCDVALIPPPPPKVKTIPPKLLGEFET